MRLVFNRSFHLRETKFGTDNASVVYGFQQLVQDPDLQLLVDAAVSKVLYLLHAYVYMYPPPPPHTHTFTTIQRGG